MPIEKVRFHPAAEEEAATAISWYLERNREAGLKFADELQRAVETVASAPERWPVHLLGTRRYLLRNFPFSVVFRVANEELEVVAVAHGKRRPGYWQERV